MAVRLKVTKEEEDHLQYLVDLGKKYGTLVIETPLFLKMVEALREGKTIGSIYGVCQYCQAPVGAEFNTCASCADERGP